MRNFLLLPIITVLLCSTTFAGISETDVTVQMVKLGLPMKYQEEIRQALDKLKRGEKSDIEFGEMLIAKGPNLAFGYDDDIWNFGGKVKAHGVEIPISDITKVRIKRFGLLSEVAYDVHFLLIPAGTSISELHDTRCGGGLAAGLQVMWFLGGSVSRLPCSRISDGASVQHAIYMVSVALGLQSNLLFEVITPLAFAKLYQLQWDGWKAIFNQVAPLFGKKASATASEAGTLSAAALDSEQMSNLSEMFSKQHFREAMNRLFRQGHSLLNGEAKASGLTVAQLDQKAAADIDMVVGELAKAQSSVFKNSVAASQITVNNTPELLKEKMGIMKGLYLPFRYLRVFIPQVTFLPIAVGE